MRRLLTDIPVWVRSRLPFVWLLALFSGCIVVEDSSFPDTSPTPTMNRPPFIQDVQVLAGYDDRYAECYWDFYAWVEDPDGLEDVASVSVSIIDDYGDGYGVVVGIYELVADAGGQWSNTVYQTYAPDANCSYAGHYAYEFAASDWSSAYDAVIVEPNAPVNAWPYFTGAEVLTGYDDAYGQCYWQFYAWVEDPDGLADIDEVYVDVQDLDDPGVLVERFYLADDGLGQWSDTIFAAYAGDADCNKPEAYQILFWVYDSAGNHDRLVP